ncbi:hypothetical protein P7H06_22025 [Paenibacillus larvae]|nr:hypothetical protein [Paenibacillus larvae]MDT2261635.1 hypothetical protein [Paenibacillus larvae]
MAIKQRLTIKGMYTGEVSNNLFGVQHQYSKNGKDADKIGWLFNYGKKESVEKEFISSHYKRRKSYTEVDDLRFQLILLTMPKQAGMKPLPTYIENIVN